jgi:surface protein
MREMFGFATSFNQPLSNWHVGNVIEMDGLFYNASSFNQDISQWCVSNITSEPSSFSVSSPLQNSYKPKWGTCPRGW